MKLSSLSGHWQLKHRLYWQRTSYNCVPTCLQMLLSSMEDKRVPTQKELAKILKTSPDGTSLFDLSVWLDHHGYKCRRWKQAGARSWLLGGVNKSCGILALKAGWRGRKNAHAVFVSGACEELVCVSDPCWRFRKWVPARELVPYCIGIIAFDLSQ